MDSKGQVVEKTFGLSLWRSLADMEQWAEFHPTHIAIFGTFMRVVQALEFKLKLRLYHEVAVLAPDEQEYEYVNCHSGRGCSTRLLDLRQQEFESRIVAQEVVVRIAIDPVPLAPAAVEDALEQLQRLLLHARLGPQANGIQ